ncbi:MAG: cupin domain-containing protein [Chloroflexi bacterium]|nr:cupin domain-containing protein [Chloroflexota bacterium]
MDAFELSDLIARQQQSGKLYLEFLKVPALSMGVYILPAGSRDPQQPHSEDEVYYVTRGQALIRVGDEERAVSAGSIVFVAANVVHYFHAIAEELTVLVFFAPAEYSNRNPAKG